MLRTRTSKRRSSSTTTKLNGRFSTKCCNLHHENWLDGKLDNYKILNFKTSKKISKEITAILFRKNLLTECSSYLCLDCVEYNLIMLSYKVIL